MAFSIVRIDDVPEIAAEYNAVAGEAIMRKLRAERMQKLENAEPGDKLAEISQIDLSIARELASQHRFIVEAWSNRYNKKSDLVRQEVRREYYVERWRLVLGCVEED